MKKVTIPAEVTAGRFIINITDDNIVECRESFDVKIVSVNSSGVIVGSANGTEVIIIDSNSK